MLATHELTHAKNASYLRAERCAGHCAAQVAEGCNRRNMKSKGGGLMYALSADEVIDSSTAIVIRTVSRESNITEVADRLLEHIAMKSIAGADIAEDITNC